MSTQFCEHCGWHPELPESHVHAAMRDGCAEMEAVYDMWIDEEGEVQWAPKVINPDVVDVEADDEGNLYPVYEPLSTEERKRKHEPIVDIDEADRQHRQLMQELHRRLDAVDRRISKCAARLRAAQAAVRESKAEVEKSRADLIAAIIRQSPSPQ